jgi:hypothetical protein
VRLDFIYAHYPSFGAKRNPLKSLDSGRPVDFRHSFVLSATPNSVALFLVIFVALCEQILCLRPEAVRSLSSFSTRGPNFT